MLLLTAIAVLIKCFKVVFPAANTESRRERRMALSGFFFFHELGIFTIPGQ